MSYSNYANYINSLQTNEGANPCCCDTSGVVLTGPTGPQGPVGPQGVPGNTGPPGAQGPQGPAGANGADGADGAQGPAGQNGQNGQNGQDGQDGQDGAVGPQGPQGVQGPPGVVQLIDEQSNTSFPSYLPSASNVNEALFAGELTSTGDLRLGINGKPFTSSLNNIQIQQTSILHDRNFIMSGATALNSKYNLPAPFPNISGIPERVNSLKWLKIKDSVDRIFYIPAYYYDNRLLDPPFLIINGKSSNIVTTMAENTFKSFQIKLENSSIAATGGATNLAFSWEVDPGNDIRFTSNVGAPPTNVNAPYFWLMPVTSRTLNDNTAVSFDIYIPNDGASESEEMYRLTIEPENPDDWNGCPESRIIEIIIPAN